MIGSLHEVVFVVMLPLPRRSTLFPYTTLFRSQAPGPGEPGDGGEGVVGDPAVAVPGVRLRHAQGRDRDRSEEHTSELQSRFDLVCRLLLEKKNAYGSDEG